MVPSSKAEIAIPVDSLLKLPSQAVYTHHSGQATATVAKKGEVIYVAATCDSLQREVEYYEELYYKARDALEKANRTSNSVKDKEESRTSLFEDLWLMLTGIVCGIGMNYAIIKIKHIKNEYSIK